MARDRKIYSPNVGLKPHHDLYIVHTVYTVYAHGGRDIPAAGRVGLNPTCDSCVLYMYIYMHAVRSCMGYPYRGCRGNPRIIYSPRVGLKLHHDLYTVYAVYIRTAVGISRTPDV